MSAFRKRSDVCPCSFGVVAGGGIWIDESVGQVIATCPCSLGVVAGGGIRIDGLDNNKWTGHTSLGVLLEAVPPRGLFEGVVVELENRLVVGVQRLASSQCCSHHTASCYGCQLSNVKSGGAYDHILMSCFAGVFMMLARREHD
ncbi:hypothetical protein V2G26_021010 [Clonostachys chloroleuca]